MISISVDGVGDAYTEVLHRLSLEGRVEESRAGQVRVFPRMMHLEMMDPTDRVLLNESRNANPFFHVLEAMWMFAGADDAHWVAKFNKRMMEYAEEDGRIHGAYGHRWRSFHGFDQIMTAANLLEENPQSRQVVIGMWDPLHDMGEDVKDRPCNTHIYLRGNRGTLDMTVCNRSNDIVWGMLGSNIVHMTMLHELLAFHARMDLGIYNVVSMNAHMYLDMPRAAEILGGFLMPHPKQNTLPPCQPLLEEGEKLEQFLDDSVALVEGKDGFHTRFFQDVIVPMYEGYLDKRTSWVEQITCPRWREACLEWTKRNW